MNDLHLSAEVHIGSWNVTPWMVRVQRTSTLCNPGEEFTIVLDPALPYDVIPNQEVTIYEQSVKVLNGFVTSVVRNRGGDAYITIVGTDKYKLARDGFIIEDEWKATGGETVDVWMGLLTERVGLEYISDNKEFSRRYVAPQTNFGLMGVGDALNLVSMYAGGYIYTDVNGRIHMRRGPRAEPYLHFAPGIYAETSGSTSGSFMSAQWEHSDKATRDTAKVFGTAWDGSYYIPAESSIDMGLPAPRTMVYATPMIQTYEEAKRLADRMVEEAGRWTDIYRFEIAGNPNVHIGRGVYWEADYGGFSTSGSGVITNVDTVTDEKGYVQMITLNERCPKIAGWQLGGLVKCLWIAAHARDTFDPRPEKLVYALTPVGLGQPTFHIVKTIPSGLIRGMVAYRTSGMGVFLVMEDGVSSELWFSENPSNEDPEWTLLLASGDSLTGGYVLDDVYFEINAIGSVQTINNTLYIGVRGRSGDTTGGFYNSYTNGAWSGWVEMPYNFYFSLVVTKNAAHFYGGAGYWGFLQMNPFGATVYGSYPESAATFDEIVRNGVTFGVIPGSVGGIWMSDEIGDSNVVFRHGTHLVRTGSFVMTVDEGDHITPRGDYHGSQVQVVLKTGDDFTGDLYVALDGSSFSKKFSWRSGIVNCIDKEDPSIMAWMPIVQGNANEVMRTSMDGGSTWANATGNWWGSHSEVTNGDVVQSDGNMTLIDFHPTFLV